MDIKKITYTVTNRLEGLSLAVPVFVVGLGFMILGVSLLPGIGILIGVFVWWIAWRFMLSSSRKSRIKEALRRIKERQATLPSSSISRYQSSTQKQDVKNQSEAKFTAKSEKQEATLSNSGH